MKWVARHLEGSRLVRPKKQTRNPKRKKANRFSVGRFLVSTVKYVRAPRPTGARTRTGRGSSEVGLCSISWERLRFGRIDRRGCQWHQARRSWDTISHRCISVPRPRRTNGSFSTLPTSNGKPSSSIVGSKISAQATNTLKIFLPLVRLWRTDQSVRETDHFQAARPSHSSPPPHVQGER